MIDHPVPTHSAVQLGQEKGIVDPLAVGREGELQTGLRAPKDGRQEVIPIEKQKSDLAMDAAACIGCGACVAACPNASASLFTAAKISHLALLPQGEPERSRRARAMVAQMRAESFGACTNHGECEAVCPKGIKLDNIARMNREFLKASWSFRDETAAGGAG